MSKSIRYSPEVRERAVRMFFDHQSESPSQWQAVVSIATKIGCTPETLRKWVRRAEVDSGWREGVTSDGRARRDGAIMVEIKRVWNENREVYGARKVWRQLLHLNLIASQPHSLPVFQRHPGR